MDWTIWGNSYGYGRSRWQTARYDGYGKHPEKSASTAKDSDKKMDGMDHSMSMKGMDDHMDMAQMDHMDHMNHMGNLKQKFWVCLIVAIPIFLLSPMMGIELPFQISFEGSDWVVLALATFLFFYGGKPFFYGAVSELRNRRPAMMTVDFHGYFSRLIFTAFMLLLQTSMSIRPLNEWIFSGNWRA